MNEIELTQDSAVKPHTMAMLLGCTARHLRQLSEDGVIHKEDGLFNLQRAIKDWVTYQQGKGKSGAGDDLSEKKAAADVKYREARAKKAQLEVRELEGKLHRSEDVKAAFEGLVYAIRQSVMGLPGRLAIAALDCDTVPEAEQAVKLELHAVLEELANYSYDPEFYHERVMERMKWEGVELSEGGEE